MSVTMLSFVNDDMKLGNVTNVIAISRKMFYEKTEGHATWKFIKKKSQIKVL